MALVGSNIVILDMTECERLLKFIESLDEFKTRTDLYRKLALFGLIDTYSTIRSIARAEYDD